MKENEYKQLVAQLNEYAEAYYKGEPKVTDDLYDRMYKRLLDHEKENPTHIDPQSPTQKVGAEIKSGFQKVRHPIRMYSLENVFNGDDLRRYYKRFSMLRQKMGVQAVDQYYLDCKMDGLSLDLVYREGKLVLAITRGDGMEGENVTANAMTIPNIPKRIPTKHNIVVHGEVLIHKADFYAINAKREADKKTTFSNARNFAAGSLRQKDPEVTRRRNLRFYAWSLFLFDRKYTCEKQIQYLTTLGFNTPVGKLCCTIEEMISFINETARVRNELPYEIDGIVIKQNDPSLYKAIGWNNHAPLWATAWKFTASGMGTVIKQLVWNMGRTGKLTPTAKLEPVNINGVVVGEVTLNNAANVENNRIGPGAKVRIIRSGDVIPKVDNYITTGTYLGIPEVCPFCGEPLERVSADVKCVNPQCKEMAIAALTYVVSKDVLDIKGIGEQTIRELIETETVHSLADIFRPLECKNGSISQGVLDSLTTRARNINLVELLTIVGITGLGRALANRIVMEVETLEGFIETLNDAEKMRLLPINEGIKKNMAAWWSRPSNQELMRELVDLHLPYCE